MKVNARGQVTIPKAIRERAGLLPHTEVELFVDGDSVSIVKTPSPNTDRGTRVIDALRRNAGTVSMSTDEIMALTRGDD